MATLLLTHGADVNAKDQKGQTPLVVAINTHHEEIAALLRKNGAAVKPNAPERLKHVKTLFDQGLITKEDYDKKVKEIMDSL